MRFKSAVTNILVVLLICIVGLMIYLLINRRPKHYTLQKEVDLVTSKYEKTEESKGLYNIQYLKYKESPYVVRKLNRIKKSIQQINERQNIINNKRYRSLEFDHTVLVIQVHPNISYLSLFFDSIKRIHDIRKSLLIFAHDYYDEDINKAITSMQYARAIQIFYPYSIQLHPEVYPGIDPKYCYKLNQCFNSHKRKPVLAQAKLFWWWVANQVFDHIHVLKDYQGYIYFFETDKYLSRDLIVMAKLLERIQPTLCSVCRFLSLGSYPPQFKLYRPMSVTFIISVWGWSNYSNSGFGFNRTTWNEMRRLRKQFCYFRDPSWENSLKHLASKMRENNLYVLFLEAPRFFPLTGCGAFRNGSECDLDRVHRDIVTFIATIRYWEGNPTFNVKFDRSFIKNEVEARGEWGDARDMDFCMFFSTEGRRLFY